MSFSRFQNLPAVTKVSDQAVSVAGKCYETASTSRMMLANRFLQAALELRSPEQLPNEWTRQDEETARDYVDSADENDDADQFDGDDEMQSEMLADEDDVAEDLLDDELGDEDDDGMMGESANCSS